MHQREGEGLNVIVHKPQTVEGNKTLQNRLALAHAEMMKDYIFKLPWEANKKVTLFEAVKDKIRAEAEKEKEGGVLIK
jgi:hypothetical protein